MLRTYRNQGQVLALSGIPGVRIHQERPDSLGKMWKKKNSVYQDFSLDHQ